VALHPLAAALSAQGRVAEALTAYQSAVEWLHGNLALTQVPFGLHVLQRQGFRPKGILDIGGRLRASRPSLASCRCWSTTRAGR
jgi:hypothetical protein